MHDLAWHLLNLFVIQGIPSVRIGFAMRVSLHAAGSSRLRDTHRVHVGAKSDLRQNKITVPGE
jgi:hypothetical protein